LHLKSPSEALSHQELQQVMIDKMSALQSGSTWELVPLVVGKPNVFLLKVI